MVVHGGHFLVVATVCLSMWLPLTYVCTVVRVWLVGGLKHVICPVRTSCPLLQITAAAVAQARGLCRVLGVLARVSRAVFGCVLLVH